MIMMMYACSAKIDVLSDILVLRNSTMFDQSYVFTMSLAMIARGCETVAEPPLDKIYCASHKHTHKRPTRGRTRHTSDVGLSSRSVC